MTTELNKQLHALLNQTGLTNAKQYLVESFSGGRETSSANLKNNEAIELIAYLKKQQQKQQQRVNDPKHIGNAMPKFKPNTTANKANTMRKKIIALAHQMGWSAIHQVSGNKVADMARINDWCVKYGYLHKPLNEYTLAELPMLVTQFQNMYNSFINAINPIFKPSK